MSRLRLFALSALLCAACGSTPATHYYLITGPDRTAQSGSGPHIGVGPVTLRGYLSRPEIVTRQGDGELKVHEFHLWAEPLNETVSQLIAQHIAAEVPSDGVFVHPFPRVPPPPLQVAIEVVSLDAHADNQAVLKARWRLSRDAGRSWGRSGLFVGRTKLQSSAPAALSAGFGDLVEQLGRAIVAELKGG